MDGCPVRRDPSGRGADLPSALSVIEVALASTGFAYRVAVFPNHLPDLGEVVDVHAFYVPESKLLDTSRQLNVLLSELRLRPMAIGMAFGVGESEGAATRVPSDAVWLLPAGPVSD